MAQVSAREHYARVRGHGCTVADVTSTLSMFRFLNHGLLDKACKRKSLPEDYITTIAKHRVREGKYWLVFQLVVPLLLL
jgi:hypothetical protein